MKTMIKTRKMYRLAAAFVVLAGFAGQAVYAGTPAVAHEIHLQGQQALKKIRGEITASLNTPVSDTVSLPSMKVYASPLDNAARRLRYSALSGIRAEMKASIAGDVAAALRTQNDVTVAEARVATAPRARMVITR